MMAYRFWYADRRPEIWYLDQLANRQWRFYQETDELVVKAYHWEEIVRAVKRLRPDLLEIEYLPKGPGGETERKI